MKFSALVLLAAIATSACVTGMANSQTFGSVIPPAAKAAVLEGSTKKTDVLRSLGTPDQSVDLGGGVEELYYITETYNTRGSFGPLGGGGTSQDRTASEFWIRFRDGVVEAKGDRSTTKSPNYAK